MATHKIIYLVGFMGSGKSTAGKKLASLLGWTFIDLDKTIEEHTGKKISGIFSDNGEEYFRQKETELLRSLVSQKNAVISTGGGAPCYGDNMDHMLKTGLTIYLKMTPQQLHSRLSGSSHIRPLIKNMNDNQLLAFIQEKLESRENCYNRAEIIIDSINLDLNSLLELIKIRNDK